MPKSSNSPRVTRSASGSVTVVEVAVARSWARRARIVLYTCLTVGPVVGLVAGMFAAGRQRVVDVLLGFGTGLVVGLLAWVLVRTWPLTRVVWHWLPEITVSVAVAMLAQTIAHLTSPVWAVLTIAGLVAVAFAVPVIRRRLVAWAGCLIVRHRLRICFTQFLRTPGGVTSASLPLIGLARSTPAGERVWIWLRPGLELADLETATGRLAVACWADEVRVVRASRHYAALIRVDIAHRDPLLARVVSPLRRLIPDTFIPAPTSPGLPPVGLDLADVPDLADGPKPARPRTPRPPAAATVAPAPADDIDAYI
jgi:hypothetical protein